jgi:hypothetical protein
MSGSSTGGRDRLNQVGVFVLHVSTRLSTGHIDIRSEGYGFKIALS